MFNNLLTECNYLSIIKAILNLYIVLTFTNICLNIFISIVVFIIRCILVKQNSFRRVLNFFLSGCLNKLFLLYYFIYMSSIYYFLYLVHPLLYSWFLFTVNPVLFMFRRIPTSNVNNANFQVGEIFSVVGEYPC